MQDGQEVRDARDLERRQSGGVVALGESLETAVADGADQARSGCAATTEFVSFARSACATRDCLWQAGG